MGKTCSLLLISTSAPLVCFSCSARSGSDACSSLFGVGAGDALWLQLSPPAASAAPCWQTHHSGGGPCHSRIRGRNPFSSWFQTLSGAQRKRQINFNETVRFYILHCFSDSLQFQVLTSSSAEAIPTLRLHLGADKGSSEGFSLILMDHDPRQYLPDLLALEREELLSPSGCSIILINRRKTHDDISDVVAEIRSRSNLYSVLSEHQFMLEVFYCKKPTNVAL